MRGSTALIDPSRNRDKTSDNSLLHRWGFVSKTKTRSTAVKVAFLANWAISSLELDWMSAFPISMNIPPTARHYQPTRNASPLSEFKTTSTPALVASRMFLPKKLFLLKNMLSESSPYVLTRCSFLAALPTVT